MRQLNPSAQRLLALILAEGFLRGISPSTSSRGYALLTGHSGEMPEWMLRVSPLLLLVALAFFLIVRVPVRPVFVLGIGLLGAGSLLKALTPSFNIFLLGQQTEHLGHGLFASAAFVLEVERFPRRWLLLGPTAYLAFYLGGQWLRPVLLDPLVPHSARFIVGGALTVLLAFAAAFMLGQGEGSLGESALEEPVQITLISKRSRFRLFAFVTFLSAVVSFLSISPPQEFGHDFGQIGPFSVSRIASVSLGQILPLAVLGFMLLRATSLGTAVRFLGSSVLLIAVIGWAFPTVRSYAYTGAYTLSSQIGALVSLALLRGTRPEWRLQNSYVLYTAILTAASIMYALFVRLTPLATGSLGTPCPVGLTISFLAAITVTIALLFSPSHKAQA